MQEDFDAFEAVATSIPEVTECIMVSGEFDFFLRVICRDMAQYLEINERLVNSINYQATIKTHVVMQENKPFNDVDLASLIAD